MPVKYGVDTLIFTGSFTDEYTDRFEKIKELGFDGVEIALAQKGDFDYGRTLEKLKANGLECIGIVGMMSLDRDIRGPDKDNIRTGIEYIKDCIDAAKAMECNLVSGPLYSAVGRANQETPEARKQQWKTVIESLKEVCAYAEEKGVLVSLEPLNRFETDFINITDDVIRLIEDVGSDNLKIHLDTFHMNIEEKSTADAIRKAGNLLTSVHANENDRGAPGTGQVRWQEIAQALKDIGYNEYLIIETFTPDNELIARAASIWRSTEENEWVLLEKGLKYLKKLFKE
jgi:D-psicose/D-tagatose/L-ribulose 3-epimerase